MSRIQQILEKAEREGTALRTSRVGAAAPPHAPVTTSVPISIEIPTPLADASAAATFQTPIVPAGAIATAAPVARVDGDDIEHIAARLDPVLVAGLSPQSLAAEQYRALRTRLAHTEGAAAIRTVMVTSPQKGEGKSVTSANLALTMAQELQRRVVIVEADLRKPSLAHLFSLPPGPGLAELLVGAADLEDVMKFLPDHHLTVIPAGTPPANPSELLGSTAMRRLLDQLRTRFDRVI